jgi:hypothetical protein
MPRSRLSTIGLLVATVVLALGWLNEANMRWVAEHQLTAARASNDSLKRLAADTEADYQMTLDELWLYKPLMYDEEALIEAMKLDPAVRDDALTERADRAADAPKRPPLARFRQPAC